MTSMSTTTTNERIAVHFRAVAVIAVLILALIGGLFHHHQNATEAAACSYCHAGVQAPVPDLARTLPTPLFTVVGAVLLEPVSRWAPILQFSSPIPRAPPTETHPVVISESCADLA
jgi:hypothetical protein